MDKNEIITEAKALFVKRWPDVNPAAACLYLTIATIAVAQQRGIRLVLQAGSMHWKCVPDELDDGVSSNHFAYVWNAQSRIAAHQFTDHHGFLPEIHVWAADPLRQEIVDASTEMFPEACAQMHAAEWKAPRPPPFIWGSHEEIPEDASYTADMEATLFAADLAFKILNY